MLGRRKRTLRIPSPCEDPLGLRSALPAVQTASLPASAVISHCWAGFGGSVSLTPPVLLLQERSGCQPAPLLLVHIQALGDSAGNSPPGHLFLGRWGPPSPPPSSVPLPWPAPDVHTVGHVSGMLWCQAVWLLAWHKPRELSSQCCCTAKHQASSISAPKPISIFRGSTLQTLRMSKCGAVHHCLRKTSARL